MEPKSITRLLENIEAGDREAVDRLFVLVYKELKSLAQRQMDSESSAHTLQTTALVHEVWMKLVGNHETPSFNGKDHFLRTAAQAMRRILVDSARARNRQKRGSGGKKFEVREDDLVTRYDAELLALDEALNKFRELDSVKADLVELRHFAGLTNAQAAQQLGISTATADRHWAFAKAWLRAQLEND